MAVGPVFLTMAMGAVSALCAAGPRLLLRDGARPPGSSSWAPGASLRLRRRVEAALRLPQRLAAALEPPNPRGMSAAWSRLRGFLRLVNPFSEASPDLFREGKREEQAEVCGA